MLKRIISVFLSFLVALGGFNLQVKAAAPDIPASLDAFQNSRTASNLRLWYDEPTTITSRNSTNQITDWQTKCLPIGNSYTGVMLAGQIESEKIQYNEKSLWTGGPSTQRSAYNGGNLDKNSAVRSVQDRFLNDASDASSSADQLVGISAGYGNYQNFGWIDITHNLGGIYDASKLSNYVRDLDLETATASTSFKYDGAGYIREYFTSYPDNVFVMRLGATEAGKININVGASSAQGGTITANDDTITTKGSILDNQMRYESQIKVINTGGTKTSNSSSIDIAGADSVLILMSAATDYKNEYPTYRSGMNPNIPVTESITKAASKTYDQLFQTHQTDFRELMDRVSLDLGQIKSPLTTDEQLSQYKSGNYTRELEVLLFQYGRYLLISASREGSLPANLQGVWNDSNTPPWGGDYHINVNLQMNYWPAYSTNLIECTPSLIDYVDSLREPGRVTVDNYGGFDNTLGDAATLAGENGFMAHTQNTPFGWTCPGWSFSWGWSPAAVPWILQNVWEYYEYTQDENYLRDKIYPIMRENAIFWTKFLIYNEQDGKYYSAPAFSPEHGPRTLGNTYEHVLIKQLFNDTLQAASVLGTDQGADKALCDKIKEMYPKIRGEEIGADGQIKEWFEETTIGSMGGDVNHRHLSHLLGLYPGDSISILQPELLNAAKVSLNRRGDVATGWGMGQRINAWARIQDGNRAHKLITDLFKNGIYNNLFDTHPPFQIDGNFGMTSGVAEMLIQSNEVFLQPLAALPDVWADGSVKGLVTRGNFVIDMNWSEKTLRQMEILSRVGEKCVLKYPNIGTVGTSLLLNSTNVTYTVVDKDTIEFDTASDASYTLILDQPTPPQAPSNVSVTSQVKSSARIIWTASISPDVQYEVWRKIGSEDFVKMNSDVIEGTTYYDTTLTTRDNVKYKVRAVKNIESGIIYSPFTDETSLILIGNERKILNEADTTVQTWGTENKNNYGVKAEIMLQGKIVSNVNNYKATKPNDLKILYLKFGLSELDVRASQIKKVSLRVNVISNAGSSNNLEVYGVNTNSWIEGTGAGTVVNDNGSQGINYNSRPLITDINSDNAITDADMLGQTPISIGAISVDITDYIKNAINTTTNEKVSIAAAVSSDKLVKFTSKEAANGNEYAPTLVLEIEPREVTSVSLNTLQLNLTKAGETVQLEAIITPEDATCKNVIWSTGDKKVATVANDVVTAVGNGKTTITATTEDGNKTAKCEVTVNIPAVVVPVTGVELNQTQVSTTTGQIITLRATVLPEDATYRKVTWTSDNLTVATVKDGKVTAVERGEANITAITEEGNYTTQCKVIVTNPENIISVTGISLDIAKVTLTTSSAITLKADITPHDASNKGIIWSTSDNDVVTVNANGKLTPVANGMAIITATTEDGAYTANCEVTVELIPTSIAVTGIRLDKPDIRLTFQGQIANLLATVEPLDATNKNVIWTTSNPAAVALANGVVTAVANGASIITTTTEDGSFSAQCIVYVSIPSSNSGSSNQEIVTPVIPVVGTNTEDPIKKVEQAIQQLPAADKKEIEKQSDKYLPYTLIATKGLSIEQLAKMTNNKFTKEELEILLNKPEMLKTLGIDTTKLSASIILKPIENASFTDVKASHWANEAIKKAAELGLVAGMPDGSFAPSESLKVADAFTFLDRVLLLNNITESSLPRSVVEQYIADKDSWAFSSVASVGSKLNEETLKIIASLEGRPLSRELLAQVLYEVTKGKLKATKTVPVFTDTNSSSYKEAIDYCVSVGLLNGTGATIMSPQKALTRAELMSVLIRMDNLLED